MNLGGKKRTSRPFGPAKFISRAESRLTVGENEPASAKPDKNIYIFPTLEGPDAEYIKVASGKVDTQKPSFA